MYDFKMGDSVIVAGVHDRYLEKGTVIGFKDNNPELPIIGFQDTGVETIPAVNLIPYSKEPVTAGQGSEHFGFLQSIAGKQSAERLKLIIAGSNRHTEHIERVIALLETGKVKVPHIAKLISAALTLDVAEDNYAQYLMPEVTSEDVQEEEPVKLTKIQQLALMLADPLYTYQRIEDELTLSVEEKSQVWRMSHAEAAKLLKHTIERMGCKAIHEALAKGYALGYLKEDKASLIR